MVTSILRQETEVPDRLGRYYGMELFRNSDSRYAIILHTKTADGSVSIGQFIPLDATEPSAARVEARRYYLVYARIRKAR